MEITADNIEQASYDMALPEGTEFRDDYSGRFMYGRECVGIVSDASPTQIVLAVAKQVTEDTMAGMDEEDQYDDALEAEVLVEAIEEVEARMGFDGMGLSTIYYWSQVSA